MTEKLIENNCNETKKQLQSVDGFCLEKEISKEAPEKDESNIDKIDYSIANKYLVELGKLFTTGEIAKESEISEIEKNAIFEIINLKQDNKTNNDLNISETMNHFYNIFTNHLITCYERCDNDKTRAEITLFVKKAIVRWSNSKTNYRSGSLFHRGSLIIGRSRLNKEKIDFDDHELVDAGLDMMKYEGNGSNKSFQHFSYSVLFSPSDVNYATGELIKILQTDDVEMKKLASKILLRLEFGQIGISEEGVKYLERMYDLGESNNPNHFVQRLTAKGDIGIFDDKKVLQKYFNLGELSDEETVVKPKVHDFAYETLFREKENETKEERAEREIYLKEFKENFFDFYDDDFFKKTGVRFNNLDFKEQGWFLITHKNADKEKREKLINFVKQFGEQGLVSFLSLEYNGNNGDKILDINEKLDEKEVEKIFSRYARMQASAQRLEETMKKSKILNERELSDGLKEKLGKNIYDAVMSRATDILSAAYQIALHGRVEAEFYNSKTVEIDGIEEVVEAMEVYEDFIEKMKGFFAEEGRYKFDYISSADYGDMQIYNFIIEDMTDGKEKYASISLREEGANEHLKNFEYDGEARINFLFSSEYISPHVQDKSRREATTFRLDRECLVFDESGENVLSKDNTKKDGKLSFDFGSIYDDAGRENSVLGRVMSVGNYYAAKEKKKKPEYYHNKESFYHELGEADVFKEIVQTVEDFIQSKYIKEANDKMKKVV